MTELALAGERWFADKGRRVSAVESVDALGSLEIVRAVFEDGGDAFYTLVPEELPWSELLARAGGRFAFRGELPVGRSQRLEVDQSHTSWRLGDVLVKCYRRLFPGPHPEVEALRVLTERRFAHVPAYAGALEWRADDSQSYAIALVVEFIPGSQEGWEWGARCAVEGDTRFAAGLGRLARALHEALAASFGARPASHADAARWQADAEAQLERAIRAEPSLEHLAAEVRRELRVLESARGRTIVGRVHGDLHIGQILRAGGRFVVVDFEGQPTLGVHDRRRRDAQLRDLASLARSLDHCGRYAVARHRANPAQTEEWIGDARRLLLGGYGDCDRALLRAFEWERALYEFTYAAAYLPEWIYAPRGGLQALAREWDER